MTVWSKEERVIVHTFNTKLFLYSFRASASSLSLLLLSRRSLSSWAFCILFLRSSYFCRCSKRLSVEKLNGLTCVGWKAWKRLVVGITQLAAASFQLSHCQKWFLFTFFPEDFFPLFELVLSGVAVSLFFTGVVLYFTGTVLPFTGVVVLPFTGVVLSFRVGLLFLGTFVIKKGWWTHNTAATLYLLVNSCWLRGLIWKRRRWRCSVVLLLFCLDCIVLI